MKRVTLGAGAAVLAFALAACSSDSAVSPSTLRLTATDTAEAAAISASDATAEDVDMMYAFGGMLGAGGAPAAVRVPAPSMVSSDTARFAFWIFTSNCTYDAGSGRFTCPAITHGGLTLQRSFALFDADGNAMDAYDASATASANFQASVTGIHTALAGEDTIARQRDVTVSGLAGAETSRTWNGTGSRDDGGFRQDADRVRTYHTTDAVTWSDVVVNLPRVENPWPMSGTITRAISGTGTVVRDGVTKTFTLQKTVTITFNGTRYVPMLVGDVAYKLDLLTGRAVKQ